MAYLEGKRYAHCNLSGKVYYFNKIDFKLKIFF